MAPSERTLALRVSGLYALFGALWIVVGDAVVAAIYGGPPIVTTLQTWKGWLFVGGSAALIYAVIHRELTGRARVEAELRASEERYRRLVDGAPEPVVVTVERRIVFANAAAASLFGESDVASLLGRHCLDLVEPARRTETERTLRAALEGRDVAARFETRLLRSAGDPVDVEVTAAAVLWEGRAAVQVLVRDVSERRRAADELARARDEALRASRLKSLFLANMSHEVRTPLNVILGFTSAIGDPASGLGGALDPAVVRSIEGAGTRLLSTMDAILDIARIESGEFEIRSGVLDLRELVPRVAEPLEDPARAKGLDFTVAVELDRALVRFDEYCLRGALRHLIENAIKFTERGAVAIRLGRSPAGELAIDVRDTGIGIDARYLERLFEPFTQEEEGYGRRFEGSGLGLALARHYVEGNGGRLAVESRKGRGSTFSIVLPRSLEDLEDPGLRPAAGPRALPSRSGGAPLSRSRPNGSTRRRA